MKKLIYNIAILSLVSVALFNCEENEDFVFENKDGIYFNVQDSLYYSFIGNFDESSIVEIPINIMGDAADMDRSYKVIVDEANTNAQEDLHYKALDDSYTFGADKFTDYLNLTVYNRDAALETENRYITLKIIPSDDFDLGYSDKLELKVYITNQIIKPSYWDVFLDLYFGEYSKVKHNIAISIMGHNFPLLEEEALNEDNGYSYSYWQIQGRITAQYFIDNEVYDENGNRIFPWPVF
jgi:hypothetical protein